jgi:hypothetical protein
LLAGRALLPSREALYVFIADLSSSPLLDGINAVVQLMVESVCTFKVEKHVRLVILEHLSDQFDVHVLDVDLLHVILESCSQALPDGPLTCKFLFIIITASLSFSWACNQSELT